jgi:ABC-2 type transport system permease protein
LLLTSPLSASSIVLGKLFAVFTVFLAGLSVTCIYPLILSTFGKVQLASAYAGIFGFAMLIGAYLSIGLYISSLTDSQVVAAVISFIVFLFSILMDGLASTLPTDKQTAVMMFTVILMIICVILYRMMHNVTIAVATGLAAEIALLVICFIKPTLFDGSIVGVFSWLSVLSRYNQFYYGIFDITGIIYYLSIMILFAFLTTQVIRKKRWS